MSTVPGRLSLDGGQTWADFDRMRVVSAGDWARRELALAEMPA